MKILIARNTIVVIEGFGISLVFHLIGGYFVAPKLEIIFPEMPQLTIALLSSSIFSTIIALCYSYIRLKYVPRAAIDRDVIVFSLAGTLAAWLVALLGVICLGNSDILLAKKLDAIENFYFLPTIAMITIVCPCLEEILYRGYFFETLRQDYGNVVALFFSSLLFVFFHGVFGCFSFGLFFIFLYSVVFTFAYIGGGILSSITAHSLLNFYLFYINT